MIIRRYEIWVDIRRKILASEPGRYDMHLTTVKAASEAEARAIARADWPRMRISRVEIAGEGVNLSELEARHE